MKPQLDKLQPYLFTAFLAALPSYGQATSPLTLDWLLNQTLKDNPGLQSAGSQAEASHYRAGGEPSLPPPMIAVGSMGANNPFSSQGRMELSFEVSQTIPFPSKFSARSRSAKKEEQGAQESVQARALALKSQAKTAYFDYFGANAKLALLEDMTQVYRDHLKRIRSGAFSSQVMQAHLLAAQSELDMVENETESIRQERIAAQATINTLLGRAADSPLGEPREVPISKLPPAPTIENLHAISTDHPRLRALQANVDSLEAKGDLAKKAWLPDFTVTYRHNRRYDQIMTNSELMLGVSLPFVYPWQPRSEARTAAAQWRASQAELRQARNEISSDLIKSYAALNSHHARLMTLENKVLPRAKERMKIVHNLSPTDMETLNEHLDAMKSLVELNTKTLEERVAYEKALAAYEELSTTNLEPIQGSNP